jgi:hypothetical protein
LDPSREIFDAASLALWLLVMRGEDCGRSDRYRAYLDARHQLSSHLKLISHSQDLSQPLFDPSSERSERLAIRNLTTEPRLFLSNLMGEVLPGLFVLVDPRLRSGDRNS